MGPTIAGTGEPWFNPRPPKKMQQYTTTKSMFYDCNESL